MTILEPTGITGTAQAVALRRAVVCLGRLEAACNAGRRRTCREQCLRIAYRKWRWFLYGESALEKAVELSRQTDADLDAAMEELDGQY